MIILNGNFLLYDTLGFLEIVLQVQNILEIWKLAHVYIDMKKIHEVVKYY